MKTSIIRCLGAILFSLLFYGQSLGLNMLLFAIITVVAVLIIRSETKFNKSFLLAAGLYLLSAVFVFTVNSLLAITTCILAFIVFAGSISGIKNAVYIQWLNGLYQSLLGALHSMMNPNKDIPKGKSNHNYKFIILTIAVVTTLVVVFATLYGKANPILGEWIAAINLDFVNFNWILTAAMGYYLILNLTSKAELDIITSIDRDASTTLSEQPISDIKATSLHREQLLGTILLGALNALIVLFIITDIWYVLHDPLEDAATLSTTVHDGVSALVTSIIIAITTILILFRGELNFYKKSETLRHFTYVWIALNIVIILLTAYKNYMYSSGFGLTYKRIGVFIYLTLCISGMVTTYVKIARKHNLLFMLKSNTRAAFILLIIISSFNWDRAITTYNLHEVGTPDISYLLSMRSSNGDILYAFAKAHPEKPMNRTSIQHRYEQWQSSLSRETWQSKTLLGLLHPNTSTYEITDTRTRY
ncbi:hypothetical protein DCS32_08475 [Dokdonia sp. Dokd-P16]|uniref:DUF4153 domain-containing protein n=1 Tax=Dokdonia sp. Dokd-P16 TaxID=2173169 RepID=UPI000D547706|nr:DUF4173 domain-containing protein [Dokdonia sp. Dokd-P16]AWH74195.1 hypothetical protein DCS32_08475 [Dokdonia sp. Dokd-P16]